MVVSTQVVRFQKSTGANGTTQDVNLNFTPKAIIVFSNGGINDGTNEAHYQYITGFSDGTNQACVATCSEDAAAVSDSARIHYNTRVFTKLDTATPTNIVCQGTVVFATNKVTFTWTVNDAVATDITLVAYGGADITAAKVNTVDIGRSTVGTQNYTGLGFNPSNQNSVLFTLAAFAQTANTSATNAIHMFGCATTAMGTIGEGNQWYNSNLCEHAADPSDTWRVSSKDKCIGVLDTVGTIGHSANLDSWITDGFTLEWDVAPSATTFKFSYMVINGGKWDSGSLNAPTTPTNDVNYPVSVSSNTLRGLLIASTAQQGTSGVPQTFSIYSIGATDATTTALAASVDEDGQATMDSYRLSASTLGIAYIMSTNGSNVDRATFDSFTTNNFRLDWPVKNGTAHFYHWVVVADSPTSTLYERPISETSVSVSEALARVQVKLKPISEPSISVSESLTRIPNYLKTISDPSITVSETLTRVQSLIKTISETAVSISETLARIPLYLKPISETAITGSESLTRIPTYVKPINESAISINDTIVRLPLYLRPISETAITTNDIIARWISVSYTLNEPSITINDSIQGALFYLRSISEGAISVNDIIARILIAIRAISDPSISTNDTIARIASYLRLISDPSVSISDAIVRIPTFVKSISESAVNTNDTIVRLLAAVRTISESAISVNDTIARIQTLIKQISESAISVNDTLQAGLLITVSLVESRIKWYYSVLTRKIT